MFLKLPFAPVFSVIFALQALVAIQVQAADDDWSRLFPAFDSLAPGDDKVECAARLLLKAQSEIDQLKEEIFDFRDGKKAFHQVSITPEDRIITGYLNTESGSRLFEGRIIGAVGSGPNAKLVLSPKPGSPSPTEDFVIPMSRVVVQDLTLSRMNTNEEKRFILGQMTKALEQGKGIAFVSLRGQATYIRSRVRAVDSKQETFTFVDDNGVNFSVPLDSIEPSLELFSIEPRPLIQIESAFMDQLQDAFENKVYVSFRASPGASQKERRFEGWVSALEVATDGEVLIQVNEHSADFMPGMAFLRLDQVRLDSLKLNPKYRVPLRPAAPGPYAVQIEGVIERNRAMGVPFEVDSDLIAAFSSFADENQASGPELPAELLSLIAGGEELRFYFSNGLGRRIRLTVRRSWNDDWSFGTTAMDHFSVDEAFVDARSGFRYSTNERLVLAQKNENPKFRPAAQLRANLRLIRYFLANDAVAETFKEEYRNLPEASNDSRSYEQILLKHGLAYYLDRGTVSAP